MSYMNPNPDVGNFPGYEPVWGFAGTGREPHLRRGDTKIFYVNAGHPAASDNNDGLDSLHPLTTIQGLINRTIAGAVQPVLESYDTIYVSGDVAEDVVTGSYLQMPSYVSIIGIGPSRYGPSWTGLNAALPSLDLRCVGWRIENFRFYGKTGAAAVVLRHTDSGADDIAIRTVIRNCYFDGMTNGLYGIESHGCYDVWIEDCTFALWNNAANTACGMCVTTTPLAIPYRNYIHGNLFHDSDNGAIWPCNGSFWWDNMFQPVGYAYSMVQVLNTSVAANPGDDNLLWGNVFPGDYSIVGGYNPGAADEWLGNWASDVAELEVGDNGITIARPT